MPSGLKTLSKSSSTSAVPQGKVEGAGHHIIPMLITTKYSMDSLLSDPDLSGVGLADRGGGGLSSIATSVESVEGHDSQGSGDYVPSVRDKRSVSLLETKQEDSGMADGFSISAPDLLLSEEDDLEQTEGQAHDANSFKARSLEGVVSVEESIMEHRSLRQMSSYSPTSDELHDTGTDHTNTSLDSDFVVVTSPNQPSSADGPQDAQGEGSWEQDKLVQSVDTARRPNKPAHHLKAHRRSLSTSDLEAMREVVKDSAEAKEQQVEARHVEGAKERGGEEKVGEVGSVRPNTTNCVAVLTPISNPDNVSSELGTPGYARRRDLDEHSQADSVQTLDTNSPRGSDESSEDEANGETDDQLSALESQVSLEPVRSGSDTHLNQQAKQNGVSNISPSPIMLRPGAAARRKAHLNRYSAEYIITNIDDDMALESDDGETTPTSLANRFSHRRINSTSIPLSNVGHSEDEPPPELEETDTFNGELGQTFVVPNGDKKLSMCSNDSVFDNSMDGDVLNLSDVDVKVNSDEGMARSMEAGRSLESSYNVSYEQSTELDERFFKQTGSPKTIRKKFAKSPTTSRRKTQKGEKGEKGGEGKGLKKADVSPTIRTLRKLLVLDEKDDSDDSDSTIGGPVRTNSAMERSMALERSSVASVHRSGSSVSDSVTLHQQHRNPTSPSLGRSGATATGGASPNSSGAHSPLMQPTSLSRDREEDMESSLDFMPSSPLAQRKGVISMGVAPPASPLSFSQTKSPPVSASSLAMLTDSIEKRSSANSSPALSSSPTPGGTSRRDREEELQEEGEEPHTPKPLPTQSIAQRRKFAKSKSFFEGGSEPTVFFIDPKEASYEGKDKEHESTVKRFIRGSLFRGSKQTSKKTAKAATISKVPSELGECPVQDSPPSSVSKRAKSAKGTRTKVTEVPAEVVPTSPSSNITRSTSMQVGLEEAGEIQANAKRRSTVYMSRYNSDDTLLSPTDTKMRGAHSLSILEEKEFGGKLTPADHSLSPTATGPAPGSGGESDVEEISSMEQLGLTANHPELQLKEEAAWKQTIDIKVYRKINKGERERQAILHELLHTEKQHFRALHVLKLIFRHGISKRVSEETLDQLFPKLDELIDISKDFIKRMEKKRGNSSMINDLSDVLLHQFSDQSYSRMLSAFSGFCSGHLNAMEIYRDLLKKKTFARLMNEMHSLKECHRLTLPDYYTKVTQRLSQLITLMNRLAKKTESLKLEHYPVLQQSMLKLQQLVAAVDQSVEDRKNLMELMDIQSRLEINVPKSSKITNRQDLKALSLTTHNRLLRKRGDAFWVGHGRQLSTSSWEGVVLYTPFLLQFGPSPQPLALCTPELKNYRRCCCFSSSNNSYFPIYRVN